MKFGYHPVMCNPEYYIPLAKAAEDAGFEDFAFPDSICFPQSPSVSKYPYNEDGKGGFLEDIPFLEPFSAIPALASHTKKITFSTHVMKLPIRQPVLVAKQVATVAVMTNNRFKFGVGLSPWKEDFIETQETWDERGKRMDEMIQLIYGLLEGNFYSFKGNFYEIPSIKICPVPTIKVPILMGGHSEPALIRAAKYLDGWMSAGLDFETNKKIVNRLDELRKEFGRSDKDFYQVTMGPDCYEPDGVKRLSELGIDECVIAFRDIYTGSEDNRTLDSMIGEINSFGDTVIKNVNG